jgi:CheY-like chemotaxis protein
VNKRVLVVDDNEINQRLVESTLSFAGYDVVCAADAASALQRIDETRIDLVVMDVSLPGMDGLQLTQKLKGDAQTRHIPVIVVTASATREDERRALAVGADGFVGKPIDTRSFPQIVRRYLESST